MENRDKELLEAYSSAVMKFDISEHYKHLVPQDDLPKLRMFLTTVRRGQVPQKEYITAYGPIFEMVDKIVENGPEAISKLKALAFQGDHVRGV
jgi:hypothetical protein